MSEPMLISPMLDNFIMGNPISNHNGVRCCPAMAKESDDKYIVKIISIPASQTQVEALLLSGAYADKEAALSYYQELVDGISDEVKTLEKLSQLEGFLPYEGMQTVPMTDGTGFDIYLLSTYRNTLQRYYQKSAMTHLGAMNLGLDLCAALAVCRKSGYLYVDLKPENVYITAEGSYRIGDLGFIKLDSLKYASLPERYRSIYTAPEINDAFAALNTTMDTYAVGLILYQAFNDGQLPFNASAQPGDMLPPPAYADYEMAEIIMKACNPDPAERWTDPIEMGQAIISYMQRNGAHDTPIVPVPEPVQEESVELAQEESTEDTIVEITENICEEVSEDDIEADAETVEDIEEVTGADDAQEEAPAQNEASTIDSSENEPQCPQNDLTIENVEITEESIYSEDAEGNLTFLDDATADETSPEHLEEEIDYNEISDEVSDILNQADELIAHPTPDPVVQPEPIDVPIPAPIVTEAEETEESSDSVEAEETTEQIVAEEVSEEGTEEMTEEFSDEEETTVPVKKSHWVRNLILALLAVGLLVGGFFFYKNYYLQPIEAIVLEGTDDGSLTVVINSSIDEKKLTVICSDTYGNQLTRPVINGKAVFEGLSPNSAFTIQVVIDGFHRLTGNTSAAYTTPTQTNIVQFTAVTGTEDGSVVLGFAIEGPDAEQWKISYQDDQNQPKESIFTGHMLTVNGLSVGQEYTFVLAPVNPLNITGTTEIKHTASKIVKTEKVIITGCINNQLSVTWLAPKDVPVDSWTVRCYNDKGFDETIVTGDTKATFNITDAKCEYTVEVTAVGMSVAQRAFASADSATITDFKVDDSNPGQLALSWNPGKLNPQDGWIVSYTIDNSATNEILCSRNDTTISPVIPGRTYHITLQSSDGTAILGGELVYTAAVADDFSGYGVSKDLMEFNMVRTPSYSGWDRYDLSSSDYTTTFEVGEEASFLVRMLHEYDTSDDNIITVFAVEDESGNIVEASISEESWINMWYRNYCELDVPKMPEVPGKYKMSIYFNGALAGETNFTVVNN